MGDTARPSAKSILSVHRAFVVQFRETSGPSRRVWQGRVEHIASGQSATFTSRAGLLAFLAPILLPDAPATSRHLSSTPEEGLPCTGRVS